MAREPKPSDGGYHALKGFFFQFDASLLEILSSDATDEIEIEGDQDFSKLQAYTQVKHRSSNFSLSQISAAVHQIIAQYASDLDKTFVLYCHFPNRIAGEEIRLSAEDLEDILARLPPDTATLYDPTIRQSFIKNFRIAFAPDFRTHFGKVITAIRGRYNSNNYDHALSQHAVLHRYLTDLVLKQPYGERKVIITALDSAIAENQKTLFVAGYLENLGTEKYLALLKRQLNPTSFNIPNRERLIVVECRLGDHCVDLIDIAAAVQRKFHKFERSPAPYLIFRNIERLHILKQALWDSGIHFADGTHFDGDRVRIEDLITKPPRPVGLKLVRDEDANTLLSRANIQDIYDFFANSPRLLEDNSARSRQMFTRETRHVAQVLS